jgi:RNA polymerase sigma-B factor
MDLQGGVADAHFDREGATTNEALLLKRYAESRDPRIEEELVECFLPFAHSLARRYRGGSEPFEDLTQVASFALVKALRGYDPARGAFKAYAAPTILGELRRHFRDHTWRLHVTRSMQERTLAIEKASDKLVREFGREPSVSEIAERLELEDEDVLDALQACESQHQLSLDAPVRRDEPEAVARIETIGDEDQGFEAIDSQLAVERCTQLTEEELTAMELRFRDDLSQHEIAVRMGVSQMQVSRLLRRSLARLLEAVQGDERPDGRRTFNQDGTDPRFPYGRLRRRRPNRRAAVSA